MDTNSPLELSNLTSLSGIVVVTMFLIEFLKRIFTGYSWFSRIPVFVYAGAISVGLAFVANRLLRTEDGSPYLEGHLGTLLWSALLSALASSGFYTWIHEPTKLNESSKLGDGMNKKIPLAAIALFFIQGCAANQEVPLVATTLDNGSKTIRETHKQWIEMLGADPGKRAELPVLTPQQQQNLRDQHEELDETFQEFKTPKPLFNNN